MWQIKIKLNEGTVCLLKDGPALIVFFIELGKPGVQGLGVVHPVDHPAILQRQMVLEIEQQIVGGHRSTSEEGSGHPA